MKRNHSRALRLEHLEPRWLLSSINQLDGVGYLLSDNGTVFQRYDIAQQQWLAPIQLEGSPGGATASLIDSDGIFVAYSQNVVRYELDGSSPTHVINATSTVHGIHSDGNLLILNHTSGLYAHFISINKNTNTLIDTMENYVDSVYGSSISTTANKIFGRSGGISPADITYASYDDSGNFGAAGDSPYHGDYPSASKTWVFPLGSKVVDDSGGVYSTSNLTRLHSFGSPIDDIAFVGNDVPIVLNDNKLTAYTATILPAGSKTLAGSATQILANSANVIAFNPSPASLNRYTTQIISLEDLQAPEPGQPVNPVGLAYRPDGIELTADGTLLLVDKETQSIFRWDPETQKYGSTIPLVDIPNYMAYSSETNTVYLAYASGLINQMNLGAIAPSETPFAVLPSAPLGLSTAGRYVFAADSSGAWNTHYTFAPDGIAISAVDWNYYSTEYIWSPVNSRMYFFRDDTSPNDLLSEAIDTDGRIGGQFDSPLHTSTGFQHPIRVSPDGTNVILGSGMVHDATTLARRPGGLANSVSDIAWLKDTVYTVRSITGYAQFQQWTGPTFAPGLVSQVQGTPVALLTLDDAVLVGIYTPSNGVPEFRVMDANLQVIPATPAISIAAAAGSKPEGHSGTTLLTFTVTRSGPTGGSVTAKWSVSGSGANPVDASDFVGSAWPGGTVSFAAGENSKVIEVNVQGNSIVEPDETFTVTLTDAAGALITTATALGAIVNDDVAMAIAPAEANQLEGNSGTTPFTFTVTRSGLISGATIVGWTLAGDGSNPADAADFGGSLPAGMISFAPGETSKTLTILVSGDDAIEADEGFFVALTEGPGVSILNTHAAGIILTDDTALSLTSLNAAKSEGNGGALFTFQVTRTGLLSGFTLAKWSVTGSGANPADAADFIGSVFPTGMIGFGPGETTQLIMVPVSGDTNLEADEGFTVTLTTPWGGAQIVTPTAVGMIYNDDAPPRPPVRRIPFRYRDLISFL